MMDAPRSGNADEWQLWLAEHHDGGAAYIAVHIAEAIDAIQAANDEFRLNNDREWRRKLDHAKAALTTEPAKVVAHISAETLSILSKGLGGLFRMSIEPSTKEVVPLYATPPSPSADLREALEVARQAIWSGGDTVSAIATIDAALALIAKQEGGS